jgi:hypothetical protein
MKNFILSILESSFKFLAAIFCLGLIFAPIRALTQIHMPLNIVLLTLFVEGSINGLFAYGFWKLSEKMKKNEEIT